MNNLKYRPLYHNSYAKDKVRLEQEIPSIVEGTNTMFFIENTDVPVDKLRDVTYGIVVVDYRPVNTDTYQKRLTLTIWDVAVHSQCI